MPQDFSPLFPAHFAVVYRARRCSGAPSDGFPTSYTSTVDLADITLTDTAIQDMPEGVPGTTHTVRSTALALYSVAAGPATNKSALDDLARQLAQDWYD